MRRRVIIIEDYHRFGGHTGFTQKQNLADVVSQSGPCKCVQVFLGNRTSYTTRKISEEDKEKTRIVCKDESKTVYVHCPYILNLAKEEGVESSVGTLIDQLDQVKGIPAACVLHIGKVGTVENVARRINEINDLKLIERGREGRVPYPLLLETAAGQGTELGRTWEEIRHLFEGLDRTTVGLCIDTQHAFASGMCSFDGYESVVKMFDEAEAILPQGPSLIHLNDSKTIFRSRVDRHESLGRGYIWAHSDESLRALFSRCFKEEIDLILETKDISGDIGKIITQYV